MEHSQAEWIWLDTRQSVSAGELSRVCAISADEIDELVQYGALEPLVQVAPAPQDLQFSADCVVGLRTACKLRVDYDLDLFTVALLVGYLNRIDALERQLQSMHARASRAGEP